MAVSFKLRTQKSVGNAPLFARIQAPKLNVNLLLCTHIEVDIEKWNYAHTSSDFKDYIKTPEDCLKGKSLGFSVKRRESCGGPES